MTSIVGMTDGKQIGGGFRIKDESAKQINIASNDKGAIQMNLKQYQQSEYTNPDCSQPFPYQATAGCI